MSRTQIQEKETNKTARANVTNFQRRKTTEIPTDGRRTNNTTYQIQALQWQEAINWENLRKLRHEYEEAQISADTADLLVDIAGNNYMTTELRVTESELGYQLQQATNTGRQLALDTANDANELAQWDRDLKWLAGIAKLQGISLQIDGMSFANTNMQQILEAQGAPINQREFMTGEGAQRGRITADQIKGLLFAPTVPALNASQEQRYEQDD